MANHALIVLTGHLGRDAETKFLTNSTPVTRFTLAVTTGFGDKKLTSWYSCSAFGDRYQKIAGYLTKGKPIIVEGRLKQDTWDDKATGAKRSKLLVTVDTFHFVGSGKGEGGAAPARAATGGGLPPIDDESVPF